MLLNSSLRCTLACDPVSSTDWHGTVSTLSRKLITIPKTKNGSTRHIPLNSVAEAAFHDLFARSRGEWRVFVNMQAEPLRGYKHWFGPAVKEAGIEGVHLVLLASHFRQQANHGRCWFEDRCRLDGTQINSNDNALCPSGSGPQTCCGWATDRSVRPWECDWHQN